MFENRSFPAPHWLASKLLGFVALLVCFSAANLWLAESLLAQAAPQPAIPGQQQTPAFDPFSTKPDKPQSTITDAGELRIAKEYNEIVTLGPVGCPVAIVGKRVVSTANGDTLATLEEAYQSYTSTGRLLSDKGTYFVAEADRSLTGNKLLVYSTATGKVLLRIPVPTSAGSLDTLTFSRDRYLILAVGRSYTAEVWDCETAKVAKEIPLPYRNIYDDRKLYFAPHGRFFAATADAGVVVCDTATGKIVASMQAPGTGVVAPGGKKPAATTRMSRMLSSRIRMEAKFAFGDIKSCAFSPDSKELAAFTTYPTPRLLVWDERGKLTVDELLGSVPRTGLKESVIWLPGGLGWLINGCVIERNSKLMVLSVRRGIGANLAIQPLDENRWLGLFGTDSTSLETVTIPWELLLRSVAAMKVDAEAYLAPNQPTSLIVEMANLRGDAIETQTLVQDAITKRLAKLDVPLEGGQQTAFRVRIVERAGDRLPIFQRQSSYDFFGVDTGRTAAEAEGEVLIEFLAAGLEQPLYREIIHVTSSRTFYEEVNDATVRKSMLNLLSYRLSELDLPYFVPKSEDMIALPAVIQ